MELPVTMDFLTTDDSSSDRDITSNPIVESLINSVVYTTKLDEMKIFRRNINDIKVDTIVESIIKESKPKSNLKRKIKSELEQNLYISYEELSHHINTFNRKVAREAKYRQLLALCKPVKILLEDIKYYPSLPTKCGPQSFKKRKMSAFDKSFLTCSLPRLNCRIIYDTQHNEADVYFLDQYNYIQEYIRFQTAKYNNKNLFATLVNDTRIAKIFCCCWYRREKYIKSLQTYPLETVKFFRKPHKCSIDFCRCCCRNNIFVPHDTSSKIATNSDTNLENAFKIPNIWFQTISETHKLHRPGLLPRSPSVVVPKPPRIKNCIQENLILHSTSIQLGNEYYRIGLDGQIEIFIKNTDSNKNWYYNYCSHLSTVKNKMVVDICCWYKREKFAAYLVKNRALTSTVSYLRNSHQCSITSCSCCCKPMNSEKTFLRLLPIVARYTNDLAKKRVTFKIQFPDPTTKAIKKSAAKALRMLKSIAKTNEASSQKTVLFNLSFNKNQSVINNTTMTEYKALSQDMSLLATSLLSKNAKLNDPQSTMKILEKISKVQFFSQGSGKRKKVFASVSGAVDNLSKTELKLLDHCFHIIKKYICNNTGQTNSNMLESVDNKEPSAASPLIPNLLTPENDINSIVYPEVHSVVRPEVDLMVYPKVVPVVPSDIDPMLCPEIDPVVYPIGDPVVCPEANPVVYSEVDPVVYPDVDAVVYPDVCPEIEPLEDPEVVPVVCPEVDPVVCAEIDPVVCPEIDPEVSPAIDPVVDPAVYPEVDPLVCPEADPVIDPVENPVVDPVLRTIVNTHKIYPIHLYSQLSAVADSKIKCYIPSFREYAGNLKRPNRNNIFDSYNTTSKITSNVDTVSKGHQVRLNVEKTIEHIDIVPANDTAAQGDVTNSQSMLGTSALADDIVATTSRDTSAATQVKGIRIKTPFEIRTFSTNNTPKTLNHEGVASEKPINVNKQGILCTTTAFSDSNSNPKTTYLLVLPSSIRP